MLIQVPEGFTLPPVDQIQAGTVPLDFHPSTEGEMVSCFRDPVWRIASGRLYKIMTKAAQDAGQAILGEGELPLFTDMATGEATSGYVADFRPNQAQLRLLRNLWFRNLVLKARQRGFTTLACILWLDHALFNPDQRCGIVAHGLKEAEGLFRDKVLFAYNRLPEFMRHDMPLAKEAADEILLAHNNSSLRVAVSMRSGTIHRLHVSEYGKICARHPEKAIEVKSGSMQAVPLSGITIVESTAEGRDGDFYKMCTLARANIGRKLTPRDYRFHFAPWWDDPGYWLDLGSGDVDITVKEHEYFDALEGLIQTALPIERRRWYIATRQAEFTGDPELMNREYPGTPDEAFSVSMEGTFYGATLVKMKARNQITFVPIKPGYPVNTLWDIGSTAGTGIWLHQYDGLHHRLVGYVEGWEKSINDMLVMLAEKRCIWGTHYLPHDAEQKKQRLTKVISLIEELRAASRLLIPGKWAVVPRVQSLTTGIRMTRELMMANLVIDAKECADGLAHIAAYRKKWDRANSCWSDEPVKADGHSEAADALRQLAQAKAMIEKSFYDQMHAAPAPMPMQEGSIDIHTGA